MTVWSAKPRGGGDKAADPTRIVQNNGACEPYLCVESRANWSIQETLAVLAARQEYGQRRERDKIFGDSIFADPAWDLLLDLFVMASEGKAVSAARACDVAGVPLSTMQKQVSALELADLIRRLPHPDDDQCFYLELTERAYEQMLSYFSLARKTYFEHRG